MLAITVAVLDGPIQRDHPTLHGAIIEQDIDPDVDALVGEPVRHGTAVASLIFGRYGQSDVKFLRRFRGISIPIFWDQAAAEKPTSGSLARAIRLAARRGANIINISAGQADSRAAVDPELAAAVEHCRRSNVLIIAAAGDGGCYGSQVPAKLPGVVAVEAQDATVRVRQSSMGNSCIAAPAYYNAALAGGGVAAVSGSSFACALVTRAAALIAADRHDRNERFDAQHVRQRLMAFGSLTGFWIADAGEFIETPAEQLTSQPDPAGQEFTYVGPWRLNDRSPKVQNQFPSVSADRFGTTTVELSGGRSIDVADLHYPCGDRLGMRLLPASDEVVSGCKSLDQELRRAQGIGDDNDIYAILSYIHPEEHRLRVAELPHRSKLYLGQRHIGAYLGRGRTSHALSGHSRWRGDRQSSMQLNLDEHPANVHIFELAGVPPAVLNRNARMVDAVIAGRARVPDTVDTINCRVFELRAILMYYRDLLRGANYLEDLDWYTNCSVHKMIVINVAMNVPHNPAAFGDILEDKDGKLWRSFTEAYEEEFELPWADTNETDFVPLWRLSGLGLSDIRPLSEREYNTYYAASRQGKPADSNAPRPLEPGCGMAWTPETLGDVLAAFVDTYCPRNRVGEVVSAGSWLLLRHVLQQRIGLSEQRYLNAVTPIVSRRLASSAAGLPPASRTQLLEEFNHRLQQWLTEADDEDPARGASLAATVERIADGARKLSKTGDISFDIDQAGPGELGNLRYVTVSADPRDGLFASPAIFHKLTRGLHKASPFVRFRTICTVVSSPHLRQIAGRRNSFSQNLREGIHMSQEAEDSTTLPDWEREPAWSDEVQTAPSALGPMAVVPSAHGGEQSSLSERQLVYALGTVGYDFPSAARRLSFQQRVAGGPENPSVLLDHLVTSPSDADALQWTLNIDGMPLYVLKPEGPFASETYNLLRTFLRDQVDEGAERVSLAGVVTGSVLHRSGVEIPVVNPDVRGMYSWTTAALLDSLRPADAAENDDDDIRGGMKNFLDRVYYEIRNLGREPWERALNYAATNAFEAERVFEAAISQNMELDTISVEPSPLAPAGSSYWDVKLLFFFPERAGESVRRAYRFTVSVDDVVPATIGPMRAWYVR